MVRLKHRYLLLNILYPEQEPAAAAAATAAQPQPPSSSLAAPRSARDVREHTPATVQFNQPTSDKLTAQLLARIVRDGVAELFGDYGSGMVAGSLVVKYLSPATSTVIIRVSRDHYRLVWAALSFVTRLPRPIEQSCVIKVVRVSGTIRKSQEEAIRRAKASILRAQRSKGDAGDMLGRMLSEDSRDVEMGGIVDRDDDDEEDEDED